MNTQATTTPVQNTSVMDFELLKEVEQFIYFEARLADNNQYRDWESLWTDDGVYWVPANGENTDPELEMSYIYDNRSRISLRVNQYYTGKRFSQNPKSALRRVISNIEILSIEGDDIHAAGNMITFESRAGSHNIWASRVEYTLRRVDGAFKMALKKVILVDNAYAQPNMSFLV